MNCPKPESNQRPSHYECGNYSENPLPPVMSYFDPEKINPIGNDFISRQRIRCRNLIENAELIIIIGVRVREHDKHLWGPLSTTAAKLMYCSGNFGGAEFDAWHKKNRSDKAISSPC